MAEDRLTSSDKSAVVVWGLNGGGAVPAGARGGGTRVGERSLPVRRVEVRVRPGGRRQARRVEVRVKDEKWQGASACCERWFGRRVGGENDMENDPVVVRVHSMVV